MTNSRASAALEQYNAVGVQSGIESAGPHRLIQMLMAGVLDKISIAIGHMQRREIEAKGRSISWAISILEGLAASLDHRQGGEIATNLALLYDYMVRRLTQANLNNDPEMLREVHRLMRAVKDGWDAIPAEIAGAGAADSAAVPAAPPPRIGVVTR